MWWKNFTFHTLTSNSWKSVLLLVWYVFCGLRIGPSNWQDHIIDVNLSVLYITYWQLNKSSNLCGPYLQFCQDVYWSLLQSWNSIYSAILRLCFLFVNNILTEQDMRYLQSSNMTIMVRGLSRVEIQIILISL